MNIEDQLTSAKEAIVAVGKGRGFVVETVQHERYVITAAHCLPKLPLAHGGSTANDRTSKRIVGPLGSPRISAECLYADPVADLAVLAAPDPLSGQREAYTAFVHSAQALRVGVLPSTQGECWLLTLDGTWTHCPTEVNSVATSLTLYGAGPGSAGGTSGSPIIDSRGLAVGLISVGNRTDAEEPWEPLLAASLPLWVLSDLDVDLQAAGARCRAYVEHLREINEAIPPVFLRDGRITDREP